MLSQEMLDLSSWACRGVPDRKVFDYLGQCAKQPVKAPRPQTSFLNGEVGGGERNRRKRRTFRQCSEHFICISFNHLIVPERGTITSPILKMKKKKKI